MARSEGLLFLSRIQRLLEIQRFQLLKIEASNISEWPFEPGSVERLVAILLAIFGVLLGVGSLS